MVRVQSWLLSPAMAGLSLDDSWRRAFLVPAALLLLAAAAVLGLGVDCPKASQRHESTAVAESDRSFLARA